MAIFSQQLFSQERFEPLSRAENASLVQMLNEAGLDSTDLCFERDWDLSTKFKSPHQLQILNDPWHALAELGRLRSICAPDSLRSSIYPLSKSLLKIAFTDPADEGLYARKAWSYHKYLHEKVQQPRHIFGFVDLLFDDVSAELKLAFKKLSPAQKDSLTAFFFSIWSENEDHAKYAGFLAQKNLVFPESIDLNSYALIFEQVDFVKLQSAYAIYQAGFDMLLKRVETMDFNHKKPIYHQSSHGLMLIGSKADDRYDHANDKRLKDRRIAFILEPGGNDIYELGLWADWQHPLYAIIDLAGDDIYRNNQPAGLFSVIGGIGSSCDLAGNDLYQSDDFAFCAFLGINIHRDKSGDDIYRSGMFAQGAAMFGLALLLDEKGSDSYSATSYAQALGGTMAVGALLDYEGDDLYYIGGKYLHKPLMPIDYRSMGQGMGFGFRPDYAGGLGLLYDHSGNDKYIGGVYAQGVGYWYAGGVLIDESGNDVYNAIYYPQGSGIHLAYGMLFDGEGDDNYYTRNGPGQGAGHDWSLGILIDKAGNDAYSIPGGNGLGLSNSVGIFVDSSGDDRYERKNDSSLGYANLSRGTGGIGLFLDAGGKDTYPDTLFKNDTTWQRGTYGIGRDVELNILAMTKTETLAETASAEIDSLAAIDEIFAIACEWEVGSAVKRVRKARAIMLHRDREAADYIVESKLDTKSGLVYRALEELVKNSDYFKQRLFSELYSADSLVVKNSMSLISATGDMLLLDFIEQLITDKKYVPAALGSLANIKTSGSIALLQGFMTHSSERYRYIAARSLVNLAMPEAYAILAKFEQDSSFLVRTMIKHNKAPME